MSSLFGIDPSLWPKASAEFDRLFEMEHAARLDALRDLRAHAPGTADAVEKLLAHAGLLATAERSGVSTASSSPAHSDAAFKHMLNEALSVHDQAHHAGESFGAWRLVELLGRGGMGEVWRAERADGLFRGDAAIKFLRADLPAERLAERFARERSMLARLNHPNIARLLDAGVGGPDGRQAYLVLEHVDGIAIDAFIRAEALDASERVRLLRDLAQAIAYAHAQWVLHRDIKPNNVLVDRAGRVKLLDFGIAAEIDSLTDTQTHSRLTELTGRGLTLEYAPPEQVIGEPTVAASDVYSLGALLFYALTGHAPFADAPSRAAMHRAVLERDAPRLLDRLRAKRGLAESGAHPAVERGSIDDDLDAIIAKALRKSPADRYQSAQAFADDLSAWLERRPISIRAEDRAYRWRLWLARHRIAATATVVAASAVLLGTWTSLAQRDQALAQAIVAERERAKAQDNERLATDALNKLARQVSATEAASRQAREARAAAELAKARTEAALESEREAAAAARRALEVAERERRSADANSRFVTGLFEAADPERTLGEKLTALQVLDAGVRALDQTFQSDPRVAAELGTTLGQIFNRLGRPDRAIELLERSEAQARTQFGEGSAQAALARYEWGIALDRKERFPDAARVLQALLDDPRLPLDLTRRLNARQQLAHALAKQGRFEDAEREQTRLEREVASLPVEHWMRAEAVASRAVIATMRGRWPEAHRLYLSIAERMKTPPPGHARDALMMRASLATSALGAGQHEYAARVLPDVVSDLENLLGPEANETLQILWFVGFTKRNAGDFAGCVEVYDRAYQRRARTSGAHHALTLDAGLWAAVCRSYRGEQAAAREALAKLGPVLLATRSASRSDLRNALTASTLALQLGEIESAQRLLSMMDSMFSELNLRQSVEAVRAEVLAVLANYKKAPDARAALSALNLIESSRLGGPSEAIVRNSTDILGARFQLLAAAADCEALARVWPPLQEATVRRRGNTHPLLTAFEATRASCGGAPVTVTPLAVGLL